MDGDLITRKDLDQIHVLLKEQAELVRDTNQIVHDMRRWGRVAFWAKVALWTVVLILPILFYPFITQVFKGVPGGLGNAANASSARLFGLPSPSEIEKALHPGT